MCPTAYFSTLGMIPIVEVPGVELRAYRGAFAGIVMSRTHGSAADHECTHL